MNSTTPKLRPRRTCCVEEDHSAASSPSSAASSSSDGLDLEMNLSFEDFQEQWLLAEDHDETKKLRRHFKKGSLGCALILLGLCALLVFAVNKTLMEADASAAKRTPIPPVQRYQPPLHSQSARKF
jgi:hypothetical protein